jgi:hypothetical protein
VSSPENENAVAFLVVDVILERLSERARYYSLARSSGDALLEEQNRIEFSALVESLLTTHLQGATAWDRGAWVEAVFPVEVAASDANVVVWGVAVWRGHAGAFLDPLLAAFELTPDCMSVQAYSLRFGDAERGLGTVRYDRRAMSGTPPRPVRWCFEFSEVR